jgi:cephalosporin hydroxylase
MTVRRFHQLYYGSPDQTWRNTFWLGTPVQKCPLDLWIYQEIIHETRPDLIIETGSLAGGSAHFLASMLDTIGQGEVLSIDIIKNPSRPSHPRLTFLTGSSTDSSIVAEVTERARSKRSVMVILDSDHQQAHVLEELRLLAPLVTGGNYLIVEDTNLNWHPVRPLNGPGPKEAVDRFLEENSDFSVDRDREKLMLTFSPGGYLRRRLRE